MKALSVVMLLVVAGALSAYAGYTAAQNWQDAAVAWALALAAISVGVYTLRETAAPAPAEEASVETRGCQFPRAGTNFRIGQER